MGKNCLRGNILWREIDFVKAFTQSFSKVFQKFLRNFFQKFLRNISTKSFELIQATVSRILLKNIKGAP